jgi:hypothetical protein
VSGSLSRLCNPSFSATVRSQPGMAVLRSLSYLMEMLVSTRPAEAATRRHFPAPGYSSSRLLVASNGDNERLIGGMRFQQTFDDLHV